MEPFGGKKMETQRSSHRVALVEGPTAEPQANVSAAIASETCSGRRAAIEEGMTLHRDRAAMLPPSANRRNGALCC